jgi:hypothetical protein
MAVLSDADREIALREFLRRTYMEDGDRCDFDQTMIRTALNGLDDWLEAHMSEANLALTQPFRGTANLAQKATLLSCIALRRADVWRETT